MVRLSIYLSRRTSTRVALLNGLTDPPLSALLASLLGFRVFPTVTAACSFDCVYRLQCQGLQ